MWLIDDSRAQWSITSWDLHIKRYEWIDVQIYWKGWSYHILILTYIQLIYISSLLELFLDFTIRISTIIYIHLELFQIIMAILQFSYPQGKVIEDPIIFSHNRILSNIPSFMNQTEIRIRCLSKFLLVLLFNLPYPCFHYNTTCQVATISVCPDSVPAKVATISMATISEVHCI